tara:strand:+ start:328 stop:735 length:408 start_codon:yes stop_codon:yes gene_type:complete
MGYNNSAKSKEIRIAADEKDKSGASKSGVKALDKDIYSMINHSSPAKNLKSAGGGLVSSTDAKPYMKDEGGPYMMGGGSWMSKHSQSKSSPLGNYDTSKGSHGHPHPDAPLKQVENVIDRDAKSSGPDQYDKKGK